LSPGFGVRGATPLQSANWPTVWNEFMADVHVLPTKLLSGVMPARESFIPPCMAA
jgi:hypothetical protein